MQRRFEATFNHPCDVLVRVSRGLDQIHKLEPGDQIAFYFPNDTPEDREALIGWAHAMRFWSDGVLGVRK